MSTGRSYYYQNYRDILSVNAELSELKFELGSDGVSHVEKFESVMQQIDSRERNRLTTREKTVCFFYTLPNTDAFWLNWQAIHDECKKPWHELRAKFLRDAKMVSVVNVVADDSSSRSWLPAYVEGQSLSDIENILIKSGYPYCRIHKSLNHAEGLYLSKRICLSRDKLRFLMSACNDSESPPMKYFDELFGAVSSNSIAALHALILRLKKLSPSAPELVYSLMNRAHPARGLTVLQWAVRVYPKTSLWVIEELLVYGAGTELALAVGHGPVSVTPTPLWTAVEKKLPIELIRLLLSFKCDIFFRSNFHPFTEDEKESLSETQEGYSLVHLAVNVGADGEILSELIKGSSGILLNDQVNRSKETPLMLAVKRKDENITKLLIGCEGINLNLKDSSGLTAYELAAIDHSFSICKLFIKQSQSLSVNYYLEIITRVKVNNHMVWRSTNELDLRDLSESDDLLPIEGYWEWIDSDWLPCGDDQADDSKCRLRHRIEVTEPFYLKEAIETISSSPQTSLNLLLHGLQHESDPIKKARVAAYFQRLLKWVDGRGRGGEEEQTVLGNTLGLLDNLSRSDLIIPSGQDQSTAYSSISNDRNAYNNQLGTIPPTFIDNFKLTSDDPATSDSDDSLLYCPACSHRFLHDRESHLTLCLSGPRRKSVGSRYTATDGRNVVEGECPICYEDLGGGGGRGVVVMDCLCKFHEKCIEEWFKRGKHCPFHHE